MQVKHKEGHVETYDVDYDIPFANMKHWIVDLNIQFEYCNHHL